MRLWKNSIKAAAYRNDDLYLKQRKNKILQRRITMKNFRKVITLLLAVLVLLSFAACSKDKDPGETNGGNNQDSVNTSSEIYDFKVNIFGDMYSMPCELSAFKDNGWEYKDNKNPELDEVNGNRHAYSDVVKKGKTITLIVFNPDAETKQFADCKVGSLYCEFSSENDLTLNLANKLSVNKDTTVEDVTKKFGEPTKTLNDENGTTLRYQKDVYAFYIFEFDAEGQLTSIDIRNRLHSHD